MLRIDTTDEDSLTIIALGKLLCVLLAQPDAECAIEGMHRVAQKIVEHAEAIQERLQAQAAVSS